MTEQKATIRLITQSELGGLEKLIAELNLTVKSIDESVKKIASGFGALALAVQKASDKVDTENNKINVSTKKMSADLVKVQQKAANDVARLQANAIMAQKRANDKAAQDAIRAKQKEADEIVKAQKHIADETAKLMAKARADAKRQVDSITNSIGSLQQKANLLPAKDLQLIKNTPQLRKELDSVKQGLDNAQKALGSMDASRAKAELDKAGKAFQELKAHTRDVKAAMDTHVKDHQKSAKDIADSWVRAGNQVGSSMRQIGQSMMNTGQTMSMLITAPLVLAGKDAITHAANFDQTMTAIAGSANVPRANLAKLEQSYLDAGAASVFSAQEQVRAGLRLQQAGVSINNAQQLAALGAKFAAANYDDSERSVSNYQEATENLMQITRMFGDAQLEAAIKSNTGDAAIRAISANADLFTTIMNKSATRMEPFMTGMTYLGPVAQSAGMSIKEASIMMGIAADAGVEGSRAGREFASGMLALFDGTDKTNEALKALGINLKDAKGNVLPMRDIIQQLNQAFYGNVKVAGKTTEANQKQVQANQDVIQAETDLKNKVLAAQSDIEKSISGNLKTSGSAATSAEISAAAKRLEANQKHLAELRAKGDKAAKSTVLSAEASVQSAQIALDKLKAKQPKTTGAAPTTEQKQALEMAKAAIQGTADQVYKQTTALMQNEKVWKNLNDTTRSQILTINKSAEARNKSLTAFSKTKTAEQGLITVNGKLAESERLRYENELLGQSGMRAWDPLIRGGINAFDEYEKSIKNGQKTEDMAKKKTDNLKDAFTKLQNAIESAMTRAFIPLIDKVFMPAIESLEKLVKWFDQLPQPVKEAAMAFAAILAVAGPLIFIFGSILFSVGMMIQGLSGLGGVITTIIIPNILPFIALMGGLLTVFGAVGLGIMGVASALIDNTNGIRDKMSGPFSKISGYFSELKTWLDDKIPKAVQGFKGFFTNLGEQLLSGINFGKIFKEIDKLKEALGNLFDAIFGKGAFEPILIAKPRRGGIAEFGRKGEKPGDEQYTTKFQQQMESLGGNIGRVFSDIANKTIPAFIDAITTVTKILSEELPKWTKLSEEEMPKIGGSFRELGDSFDRLARALQGAGDATGGAKTFLDFLNDLSKFNMELVNGIIKSLAEAINMLAGAIENLKKGDIKQALGDMMGFGAKQGKTALQINPISWIAGGFIKAASGGESDFNSVLDGYFNSFSSFGTNMTNEWKQSETDLGTISENIKLDTLREFGNMSDELVGHSIVPDMVAKIDQWMNQLVQTWTNQWNTMAQVAVNSINSINMSVQSIASIEPMELAIATPNIASPQLGVAGGKTSNVTVNVGSVNNEETAYVLAQQIAGIMRDNDR